MQKDKVARPVTSTGREGSSASWMGRRKQQGERKEELKSGAERKL
jgi:hypothetical protein